MLLSDHYDECAYQIEDYMNGLDEDPWSPINEGPFNAIVDVCHGPVPDNEVLIALNHKKNENDKRCMHEMRGALPLNVYAYVCGCKTTKEIWEKMKAKF